LASETTKPRSPVFIVGSARSGTSATVNAFLAAGYHGFREGQFLPLAQRIDAIIDHHYKSMHSGNSKVMIGQVNRSALKASINLLFRDIVDKVNPEPPWFDKTGGAEMIRFLPTVLTLWPSAGVVFLKRRAIENILSRTKKFPQQSFDNHCTDWAKNMTAWREIRETLPPDRFIEIDQYDMINNLTQIASGLATFLGVDGEMAEAIETIDTVGTTQYRHAALGCL
jgi:hypothetical protein